MAEHVQAWQCIGCGKIEASQPCIGICQDRKVEFVYASEHGEALAQLALVREQVDTLAAVVRQLAWTKPHQDQWEHSFRALQEQARRTLAAIPGSARDVVA